MWCYRVGLVAISVLGDVAGARGLQLVALDVTLFLLLALIALGEPLDRRWRAYHDDVD